MEKVIPKIIYEDECVLVVDKPAGMIVNRADTTKNVETLQGWVESKFPISNFQFPIDERNKDFVERVGIVHRLDKETSGLLIVAKDLESFENLQAQFKSGKVEKTYIALVHGKVIPAEGEINVPVGRVPWDRRRFGVVLEGKESRTLYKVLDCKTLRSGKKEEILTLVEVYPKTGRTHQIRVHFRYIGNPIFGDELYAGRKNMKSDRKLLPRHFLHAAKIKFFHPVRYASASVAGGPKTNEIIQLESSLPKELSDFLSKLE
ncbi:RluA family pseudouridine synthase [Candidatus Parcubacteria bacterium]|nr:MAG: RluA family pseudouridine synthase [Candidatus Parcubacteria bacterium]